MSEFSRKWFPYSSAQPEMRLRLFCFPHAGGTARMYRSWQERFSPSIEIHAIQLPGHGSRLREQPFTAMDPMVEAIDKAICDQLDRPFAFFGHSLGALIGLELAHKLRSERKLEPYHLFIAACRPPHIPHIASITYNLPEEEFIASLRDLQGTPTEVLDNPELMDSLMPSLRADFQVLQTYRFTERETLGCPITVIGGTADREVQHTDLERWRDRSKGSFALHLLMASHFFCPLMARLCKRLSHSNFLNSLAD